MTAIIITFYAVAILFLIGSCMAAARSDDAERALIQSNHSPDLPTAKTADNGDVAACPEVAQP